jgi:hypothetical protein
MLRAGRAAVQVPPNTKPKRYAGFLMDRHWTRKLMGELIAFKPKSPFTKWLY